MNRIKIINVKNKCKTMKEVFREFLNSCRVKNLSEKTLTYYEDNYYEFAKFYDDENLINSITKETVESYILHLKNNTGNNDRSINTRLSALRTFLYFAMKENYIEEFKISLIKAVETIKETYTEEELKLLLQKPNLKKCSFPEYRDWTIIAYIIATGNRLSSVINIQIKDVDLDSQIIYLRHTKNKKQQIVVLSNSIIKILREYLPIRSGSSEDYLFCNQYGSKLTTNALETSIARYNKRKGVNKKSIHLLRHTFTKMAINNDMPLFNVMSALGHSDVSMTKKYYNIYNNELKQNWDKYNPLENLVIVKKSIKMR
ncbi:tyrosine-type recombinase/integrase [Candidatus Clostridium stratigraminis]|uniref:Tyrosine-type recombinase/integrase n=1 Tax=Candidatus Clostridium stratigraminis TaxID=3381661 RepID=A0ABW8T9H8_9CLOT